MKLPERFPVAVKRGSSAVRIYNTPDRGYEGYTLAFDDGKKRVRRKFSDFATAKREGELIATKLRRGELDVLTLTSQDRNAYALALRTLKPTGISLDVAVARYVNAHKLLESVPLADAVDFYLKRHPRRLERKTVSAVVEELIDSKQSKGRSRVYVSDLRYRCGKFAESFRCDIQSIDRKHIEGFLDHLMLSPRSKNNFFLAIRTLFRFAVSKKYLSKDFDEFEGIERHSQSNEAIEVFTPAELRRILAHTRPEMIPFVSLGAFAGLRHAELCPLDWSEVDLESGFITVQAVKAKTKSRRLVPISPNLIEWLMMSPYKSGRVVPSRCVGDQIIELCKATEERDVQTGKVTRSPLLWKRNGLRNFSSAIALPRSRTSTRSRLKLETVPGLSTRTTVSWSVQQWLKSGSRSCLEPPRTSSPCQCRSRSGLSRICHEKVPEKHCTVDSEWVKWRP